MEKLKVITAAQMASVSNISHLTNDRIEALAGGHGMLNLSIHTVANVIVEEILGGASVSIKFADVKELPVEGILKKCIETAKQSGADAANAALITATLMYLAGSAAQVGIPAGNRKLGATCRMLAGVDRSGVSAVPTSKMNNKISAFPAVLAINQAMMEGRLSPINGRDVPPNISGSPLFGHSALGEDIVWPVLSAKGAEIGTRAMMDAMAGAGITPDPFQAAVLGSAAILEIIHPDAEVPESEGTYGRTSSVRLVGKAAAKAAGLPEVLHMIATGKEYDTGQLVGDLGLIIKDIGGPSVIGMMAFGEILACFEERISGSSASPANPPVGHVGGYAVVAMKGLLEGEMTEEELTQAIIKERTESNIYPESALLNINTIARKAAELKRGPVTDIMINGTEPARVKAILEKADFAYDNLSRGKSIAEVVKALDDERLKTLEERTGERFTKQLGEPVTIKIENVGSGARRTSKLAKKYAAFDLYCDVTVTRGDRVAEMKGFVHDVIPRACQGELKDLLWAIPIAAIPVDDIALAGCNILNLVVPVAAACAMGLGDPKEIAGEAEKAAYISAAIPGGKAHAAAVGTLAKSIIDVL